MGHSAGWLLLVAAAGLYLVLRAARLWMQRLERERQRHEQAAELHLATIEALALAIDAKDHTAQNHIRRVQFYASELAREAGVPPEECQGIRTAALLHDIGKLAVPEHILTKPGTLTPDEWRKVRSHPQIGADILAAIPFPSPVSPLVRSHHERWDGLGYPDGLKGDAIPLGARILAIADHYDSLVSQRTYRAALTPEAAIDVLKLESGKALDPRLVELFTRLTPRLHTRSTGAGSPLPASQGSHGEALPAVFDDIALAHREMYALYEIAQTMGTSLGVSDTMALIASKLAPLVPFSTCALFLASGAPHSMQCRFATGVDAELLAGLSTRGGQGLAGWVARNRRPLVNARPSAELEASGLDPQTSLESALVCPLLFGQHLIGAVAVYHVAPGFYGDDHRRLLERVCEQAGAVIHNAIIFERTQEDSLTDPLTSLPNTRFMATHLTRELARAARLKSEISLLLVDVDGFKAINDTYGHHVGDRALREVARVLRTAIRPYDVCVRYAGDEFVVILPGFGADEAENKRRELQEAVDATVIDGGTGIPIPVGVSVGAAVFPRDGESYESLLTTADSRMYVDKAQRKRAQIERQSIA